ncbi:hypothetical protein GGU11DRAFT_153568 [Lentinula aff. detonsa]|nr:hypothetical protein GGU11DRAFT_153568 [Lentinula aff. detonsa]
MNRMLNFNSIPQKLSPSISNDDQDMKRSYCNCKPCCLFPVLRPCTSRESSTTLYNSTSTRILLRKPLLTILNNTLQYIFELLILGAACAIAVLVATHQAALYQFLGGTQSDFLSGNMCQIFCVPPCDYSTNPTTASGYSSTWKKLISFLSNVRR